MSRMRDELTLPDGVQIPAELEAAWSWMEEQGYGEVGDDGGYLVTPYAGPQQWGPVFSTRESLTGWLEPGQAGHDRLVPLAEVGGDGSTAALWRTGAEETKVVLLGSDGDAHVLAETALDFLRLLAVGYVELTYVGGEPDEPEAVAALAGFRSWLEATYGVTVPAQWPDLPDRDDFTEWLWARVEEAKAATAAAQAAHAPPTLLTDRLTGELATMITWLTAPDALEQATTFVGTPEAASERNLQAPGLYVSFARSGEPVAQAVEVTLRGESVYPRPDRVIDGIDASSTSADVQARLGPPAEDRGHGLFYALPGDVTLRVWFDDDGVQRVNVTRF